MAVPVAIAMIPVMMAMTAEEEEEEAADEEEEPSVVFVGGVRAPGQGSLRSMASRRRTALETASSMAQRCEWGPRLGLFFLEGPQLRALV